MRRKKQYYDDEPETLCSYYVKHERNPCGCGSNLYHYEYDGKDVYGVCNACWEDIYILNEDYAQEELKKRIWK